MKIDILRYPNKKTVSIFASTSINEKVYYLKLSKQGWLQLEYVGKNPHSIPAFMEMPEEISNQFLSELTLALGRYGFFARPRKKTLMERIKSLWQ